MELNKIYQGHVIDVLKGMPDGAVDCVITSPPYWSLRDFKAEPQVWDGGWRGSLGLEPTMELFLDHLLQVFDEVRRVLKDTGTMFVNIGDRYSASGGPVKNTWGDVLGQSKASKESEYYNKSRRATTLPAKSLCGIPERFVIAMTDRGWIRRNTLVWHKPNPMPSSATDRFTVDFEPVYFFTKQGKYWFERQFEAHKAKSIERYKHGINRLKKDDTGYVWADNYDDVYGNPQGRNKRCVWTIPTFPFPGSHFATFPPKLVEPMILSGCPEGGVVMDIFIGAGTVGVVAQQHRRNWVGIELNPEYIEMAEKRIAHPNNSQVKLL